MEGKLKQVVPTNYVHKSIIHRQNIDKERRYETKNFKYDYTFSPYTCN
jgi:hypothetical protein